MASHGGTNGIAPHADGSADLHVDGVPRRHRLAEQLGLAEHVGGRLRSANSAAAEVSEREWRRRQKRRSDCR